MESTKRKMLAPIGYALALVALCSLALIPQLALADDEASGDAASGSAANASGKRSYDAPVADEKSETVR